MPISVLQFGLGEIGTRIAKLLTEKEGIEIIGATDIDPEKVGLNLSGYLGIEEELGVKVLEDPQEVFSKEPDLVLHSTGSHVPDIYPQLEQCIKAGASVISTTEELSYPYLRNPDLSRDLDEMAEKEGVSVLGTGINPGFIMDYLPTVVSGPMQEVQSVFVQRIQDASVRRKPLQSKIGVGLDQEDFQTEIAEEGGHVGLAESVAIVGGGMGLELEEITETIEPVIAEEGKTTDFFHADPGQVIGIKQVSIGRYKGEALITLDLRMYLDAEEPRDYIKIEGSPEMELTLSGGTHGDVATPAVAVNCIPKIVEASPGLHTMITLPSPAYFEDLDNKDIILSNILS
ncbi:dihydrodipicolinate reductase [Candidatus Bipolaricaulota bacterium]|nr:dihydrodipicolinate reductase [Candidatus Bipolaricaulota bacterium]